MVEMPINYVIEAQDRATKILQGVNSQVDKMSAQASKASASLDGMSRKVGGWSGAILGAIASIGALKIVDSVDKLNDLSDSLQISIEGLGKMKYIAERSGSSLDSYAQAIKKMSVYTYEARDKTSDAATELSALGISIYNSNGNLESQERLFYKSIIALSKLTDNTRKTTAAQKIFGREAFSSVLPLINKGTAELLKYSDRVDELGVISSEAAGVSDNFMDSLQDVKQSLTNLYNILAPKILPILTNFANQIALVITQLQNLPTWVTSVVGGLIGGAGLVFGIAKTVEIVGALKLALLALNTSNPFGWIAIAITGLVALMAWLNDTFKLADKIKNVFSGTTTPTTKTTTTTSDTGKSTSGANANVNTTGLAITDELRKIAAQMAAVSNLQERMAANTDFKMYVLEIFKKSDKKTDYPDLLTQYSALTEILKKNADYGKATVAEVKKTEKRIKTTGEKASVDAVDLRALEKETVASISGTNAILASIPGGPTQTVGAADGAENVTEVGGWSALIRDATININEFATTLGSVFSGDLFASIESFGGEIGQLFTIFTSTNPLMEVLRVILQALIDTVLPVLNTTLAPIIDMLTWVGTIIGEMLIPIITLLQPIVEAIISTLAVVLYPILLLLKPFLSFIGTILAALTPMFEILGDVMLWVYNNILRPIVYGINVVMISLFNAVVAVMNGIKWVINSILDAIGTFWSDAKKYKMAYSEYSSVGTYGEGDYAAISTNTLTSDIASATLVGQIVGSTTTTASASVASATTASTSGSSYTTTEQRPINVNINNSGVIAGFDSEPAFFGWVVDGIRDAEALGK